MLGKVHKEQLDRKRLWVANIVSLLMGFSQAILIYVLSSYFLLSSGSENVGIFFGVAYAISLTIILNLHKVMHSIGKANTYFFALIIKIIVITLLMSVAPSRMGIALLVVYLIVVNIEWATLDSILESYSTDRRSGRIRGMHLTILNAGFILGPFISAKVLGYAGFHGIFVLSFIASAVTFVVALPAFRNVNHRFEQRLSVVDIIRKMIINKDTLRIFYISFVLEFFYALMIIYTPIYLVNLGYSWDKIGMIFTIMLLPFVILQYPMGILADKKFGEKEFLIGALFLMGISTCAVYFVGLASVAVWGLILLLTRVGAASIEILRDSYFFKKIDGHDVDMINLFRSAVPVAFIIGTAVSSCIIFFFSIKLMFIVIGVVVLSALYPAFKLKDNLSEREIS